MGIFALGKQKAGSKLESPIIWNFPSTNHGLDQGFFDSQLEYFQGDHEKYIAREAIQNAIDARLKYTIPVTVEFSKFNIKTNQLPGWEMLLDRCKRCLEYVKNQEKAENFFKNAISLLEGDEIPVLKISDYNTTGLFGADDDREGGWYRLVRADGVSSPKGVGGGCFGIGKGAPIAASQLRTVFYSSINDKNEPVFQGKARLVSHYDDERDVRQGVGFYGIEGYRAVRNPDLIPDTFKRDKRGTDIYIIGYGANDGWKDKLVESVMQNSWLAVLDGDLEVIISDGEKKFINKETLKECFSNYNTGDAAFFYEARTSWTQKFEVELKHLGKVALYVKKADNYPYPGKVMMVRKPKMLVEARSYRVLREPYAGIFICDNEKGNRLLRDLEPPAHNEWDKERAKNGWAAMGELDSFIKDNLRGMGQILSSEPQDIPGLDRYLPDSEERDYLSESNEMPTHPTDAIDDDESGREIGAIQEPSNQDVEKVIRKVSVKSAISGKGSDSGGRLEPIHDGLGEGGGIFGGGDGEGNNQGKRIKTADVSFRSFAQKTKQGIEYHFVITGRENCDGMVRIVAVGDDGNYPVDLDNARDVDSKKELEISGSFIKGLSIKKGDTIRLSVTLKSKKKYALAIEKYEG